MKVNFRETGWHLMKNRIYKEITISKNKIYKEYITKACTGNIRAASEGIK